MSTFDVRGKVALVTGANRGIGRAITASLIEAGAAKVYAAVRRPESAADLVKEFGAKVVPIALDLSDDATIRGAASKATDVQLVVNNAGVLEPAGPLDDHTFKALEYELDVNLFGLLRVARAFAPVLKQNGGGAFVQINSVVSLAAFPTGATYSASKAASYSITQSLRAVLAEQGTSVFSVHPGPIATDMATTAGIQDIAEPPALVGEAILAAFKSGDFHVFPDSMARDYGKAYESYAKSVIEADATVA